ncbi:hypothetical protein EON78_03830 [bacterium]|nr:MAG: hypothetical protein EON78_03830 [bacterium]
MTPTSARTERRESLEAEVKQEFQVEGNMRAVGSTNLTSDYDATILGLTSTKKGEEGKPVSQEVQARIVAKFNEEFRNVFGVESGTAFDTNIYVDDFELNDKKLKMDKLEPAIQTKDDKNQDSLALVKQRIHMNDDQWGEYVSSVVDALPVATPEQRTKKEAVKANYDQANTYASSRQEEIDKKIVTLNPRADSGDIANLSKAQIKTLAAQIKREAGSKAGDIEAQALNRLYEEKLIAVKQAEDSGLTIKPGPDGKPTALKQESDVQVKKLKGEALFFANEPYFSEGGVRHIVGNLQKLAKEPIDKQFEITPAQALQSISENIGDSMKEYNHFKDTDLGTFAYKASKYINRLADAITIGAGKPEGVGADKKLVIPDTVKITIDSKEYALKDVVAELKAINKPLLDIRGEKVGKELDGQGKAELAVGEFNKTTKLDVFKAVTAPAHYQKLLLDITSQVNIALRK